jgi:cysteine synthase
LGRAVQRARERNIIIPTFKQHKNPSLIPGAIQDRLKSVGLWDVNPLNLFRITWKNEPVSRGGGFNGVNYLEFPRSLTGVEARIIALVGKWFPTGAHKVGATFGCLVPRLVTGQFDPTTQKAVWPSTGNYCRGGAYDATLLACESIAILPQGMSKERFEWLRSVAGEIIATPGTESNVKEIFDKCWELRQTREDIVIFNQFDEFGNYLWHYEVTGHAMQEVLERELRPADTYRGVVLTTGSAGTIGCGDYMKQLFPASKVAASEALQCPTLLLNGFGEHRIEGIGDKHVTWIHNVLNMDAIMCIDDMSCVRGLALLTNPVGREALVRRYGVSEADVDAMSKFFGISSVCNVLGAIKTAKFYNFGPDDVVVTICTDAIDRYYSVMDWLEGAEGKMDEAMAVGRVESTFRGQKLDYISEGSREARERWHNLKYYTWVEQQGKTVEELDAQRDPAWWRAHQEMVGEIDKRIVAVRKV